MAALNQSSVFGAAGLLPGQYISAVVMGQAVAGIFTSIVRIISIVGAHQAGQYSYTAARPWLPWLPSVARLNHDPFECSLV